MYNNKEAVLRAVCAHPKTHRYIILATSIQATTKQTNMGTVDTEINLRTTLIDLTEQKENLFTFTQEGASFSKEEWKGSDIKDLVTLTVMIIFTRSHWR